MSILKKVNSYFVPTDARCPNLISWKHSFNRLNEEYEIARKKQQALDGLYEKGKISQSTHDSFNMEIAAAITEIEKQQQDLLHKMHAKTVELQDQIKILEKLLANYEIQHVTGEIDENTYNLEINLLSNGLETAKNELQTVNDAVIKLCPPTIAAPTIDDIITEDIATEPVEASAIEETQELAAETPIETSSEETFVCEPAETTVVENEIPASDVLPSTEMPAEVIENSISEEIIVEAPVTEAENEIPSVEVDVSADVIDAASEVVEAAPEVSVEESVVEEPSVEVSGVADAEIDVSAADVEAPVAGEQVEENAEIMDQPIAEKISVDVPAVEEGLSENLEVEAPSLEAEIADPSVEVDVSADVIDAASEVVEAAPEVSVEESVVEEPSVEVPAVEEAEIDLPTEDAEATNEEMLMDEPVAEVTDNAELQEATPEPEPEMAEEIQPDKEESLDEFEVATPEIIQKEIVQAGEEITENPFSEAPLEAQEASAETNEVSDDTLTATHHAKETITEGIAETETYTDEQQE
jgi:hypothetical protein